MAMQQRKRGVRAEQERNPNEIRTDTRPISRKIGEALRSQVLVGSVLAVSAIAMLRLPEIVDCLFVACGLLFWFSRSKPVSLPFNMPAWYGGLDPNDVNPATNKAGPSAGVLYLGNDLVTGEQLWLTDDYIRRHMSLFGTTGSGKSWALRALTANALAWGSGLLYVDGKADNELYAAIYKLCQRFGRLDDLRVLNFMTGGGVGQRMSNTLNPFEFGDASTLKELVVGLMDESGGDNAMWKGRAEGLMTALMRTLVELRDKGHIRLYVETVRTFLKLEYIIDLLYGRPIEHGQADDPHRVVLRDYQLSPDAKRALYGYLISLAGFDESKAKQAKPQGEDPNKQHGFLFMQFTKLLGELADNYGYIFSPGGGFGEVEMKDVVMNRRILVVLIPALEKSEEGVANLGKIAVATLKIMMAQSLGTSIEGDVRDIIDSKPTKSNSSFLSIFDEAGSYMAQGFGNMAAQARSLGIPMVVSGQDFHGFKKRGQTLEREFQQVMSNMGTNGLMKLKDAGETWEFHEKLAGRVFTTEESGMSGEAGLAGMNFHSTNSVGYHERSRLHWLDVTSQRSGETFWIREDLLVSSKMFVANVKIEGVVGINHFLRIRPPVAAASPGDEKEIANVVHLLNQDPGAIDAAAPPTDPFLAAAFRLFDGVEAARQKKVRIPLSRAEIAAAAVASASRVNLTAPDESDGIMSSPSLEEAGIRTETPSLVPPDAQAHRAPRADAGNEAEDLIDGIVRDHAAPAAGAVLTRRNVSAAERAEAGSDPQPDTLDGHDVQKAAERQRRLASATSVIQTRDMARIAGEATETDDDGDDPTGWVMQPSDVDHMQHRPSATAKLVDDVLSDGSTRELTALAQRTGDTKDVVGMARRAAGSALSYPAQPQPKRHVSGRAAAQMFRAMQTDILERGGEEKKQ